MITTEAERMNNTTSEARKNIAMQIHHEINRSLQALREHYGPESEHSAIHELSNEKEMAARALARFGVEVV